MTEEGSPYGVGTRCFSSSNQLRTTWICGVVNSGDERRANQTGDLAVTDPAIRVKRAANGGTDLSLLRYLAKDVLQVEAASGGRRRRRPVRPTASATALATSHTARRSSARFCISASIITSAPGRIADYLQRFHQVADGALNRAPHCSASTA